jgi:hypothetical protein
MGCLAAKSDANTEQQMPNNVAPQVFEEVPKESSPDNKADELEGTKNQVPVETKVCY